MDELLAPAGPPTAPATAAATVTDAAPLEQRLHPDSELHRDVLARLNARRDLSERHISTRYDQWDQVDEQCRLYIDLARKAKKADQTVDVNKTEMPFARAIVLPIALAIMLVRLTQLMSIFGSRSPLLQLEGRGPEDVRPAKIMESVLGYDLEQTVALIPLYALCQDAEKYGVGVIYDTWEDEQGWSAKPPMPLPPMVLPFVKMLWPDMLRPQWTWGPLRQYNKWEAVDPFHYWPDPRVPIGQPQQGEFCGHRVFRGSLYLKERARPNGPYFNLEHLGKMNAGANAGSRITTGATGRRATSRDRFAKEEFSLRGSPDPDDKGFFSLDHMQVKLIPKDWKLEAGDKPEVWWFSTADETLIVRAHRAEYKHGQFTYGVGESIPDEHALFNPGMIENLDGIVRTANWLVNSHIENARKFLNDALIYAPSLIEEADLLNPGPARHIRLTTKGENLLLQGQLTLANLLYQFPFADVTKGHLQTANVLFDFAQRLAATSDPQMSQPTEDKRTLGEVQQVIASSSQRMAIVARMLDAKALQPLAYRAIANRQQFTTLEQYIRITGDLAKEVGDDRILVAPGDLAGGFDYIPHSGSLPPDPARFAQVWMKLFEAVAKVPQLQMPNAEGRRLSLTEIFNEGARALGVKNVEQLYEDVRVEAAAAIQSGVEQGNMLPADQVPPTGPIPGAGIQTPIVQGADLVNGGPA